MQFLENQKHLLQILSDGEFHSGTVLAKSLNLSRSAIWKFVNVLQESGIEIVAVSGKGYRLNAAIELLDSTFISNQLSNTIKRSVTVLEVHDQIDSTNSYLSELAYQQPESTGIVCLAEQQTAGRGRRGRQWVSPFGCNIYLSILWQFQEGASSLSGLSLAIGVAVIKALQVHQIEQVGLKWPNDIYWQQKKLGGILIEVSGETNGPCSAVIGLGLNVFLPECETAEIEQAWTDIRQIVGGGSSISRNQLIVTLIEQIIRVISSYSQQSFAQYREQWRYFDCMQGQYVNLFMGQKKIEGIVQGIDSEGLLLLKLQDGQVERFASGEVSFRSE